jgi:hypothetical protein
MSAKSQWFGLEAPQGTESDADDERGLVDVVAGWGNGIRRIPHA